MRENCNIKNFGKYYKLYIYNENKKYINYEFIDGVGRYIIDIKNNKDSGIEFFADKILDYLKSKEDIDIITCVPSSKKGSASCEKIID